MDLCFSCSRNVGGDGHITSALKHRLVATRKAEPIIVAKTCDEEEKEQNTSSEMDLGYGGIRSPRDLAFRFLRVSENETSLAGCVVCSSKAGAAATASSSSSSAQIKG
jgi:hypothetical protein